MPSLKKFGTEPTIPPFQPWTFLPAFVRGQQTCLADPSWDYEISFTNFLHPKFYGNPIILETRPRVSGLLHRVRALHLRYSPPRDFNHVLVPFFRHHHWQYNSRVFYLDYFWSPNVRTLILNGLPVLGAMMKQVCWHSRRSKAYRGLPEKPRTKRGSRELESIYYGGTPMRHRKTACFGALVLEPHFAQILRPLLATYMGKVLAAAGSESFMVEKSIAGSGARAEPLQAAAQSVATGISTVLLWLADAIRHCFLMLALLRPSRRTRQNRNRQQSAASGC